MIVLPPNTIQNGGDAVALYHSTTRTYSMGMAVTEAGLVDAVVYKSRASDRADKLLKVLTPGQSILYEDNSHSSQDESLSRCNSQSPRLHSSFQVTVTTPFGENACANASAPAPAPALLLNELSLANGTALFVELKGKPGAPLRGYTLVFYSGQDGNAYARIPLQGTIGATGLFVLAPAEAPGPAQEAPSARGGTRAVAVYRGGQAPIPAGMPVTLENLVDRGQRRAGPPWLVSLSRCSCCDARAALEYAVSDPSPGLENRCPLKSFAVALGLCLLTPNCSVWTAAPEGALHSLEGALTKSMEETCACGVSQFYLHAELNFTCTDSMLQLTGQVWAKSLEQQHLILDWHRNFTTSPHPFSVAGRVLRAKGK
nr:uncharacterized protein LOC106731912 [Pelodiscus sinensis]|eukprot:XP_014428363.1 uncharacterized protein LOC106731912 [Pelodiscus sinensis]